MEKRGQRETIFSPDALFLASSCAIALERTAKRWKVGL
jgi:hypothetical protein